MKLYLLHKIVRLNECLPEADKDFEVTPFEKLVMDDVLHSMDAAHLKGLICVDEDSEWYKDFTDECVSVCEDPELAKELHDLELPENMRKEYFEGRVNRLEAVKLGSLHQRMAGGDLKDLEERFERLDEAMIDILIDHFLSCRMGRTDGMPEEFVLEDLRMDALKDLEERFERLDEAMIDILIDHFLSCRMGRTDGMPEEFVLEDLRMDAPNRYEAALAV